MRLHVGLEDPQDLIDDLQRGLLALSMHESLKDKTEKTENEDAGSVQICAT